MSFDYETYLSPFTWRYGSLEMRQIWSEAHKRLLWRQIWLALAEVEAEFGLVQPEQLDDLRRHVADLDVPRALQIEAEIHHDLMAELKTFAEQAPEGGRILHLGATSTDIEDNADVLRLRQSLDLLLEKLRPLLLDFAEKIELWADAPLIAFTHLQPAEPSTLGYRLATYAQDLFMDWQALTDSRASLRGKGLRGAVGTGAAYGELVGVEALPAFQKRLSEKLELPFFPIATQVYPRKQDYQVVSALAGLGASLYKFAFDLRILQSAPIGEWRESFGHQQVGSSAMPFKRNPVNAEKVNSLARLLAQMPRLAWDNAAHSLLERTLDDSANRRVLLAESCLLADEILLSSSKLLANLQVDKDAMRRNLAEYGPFAAIEPLLMALGKAGADRQAMHERLRQHALKAWDAIQLGQPNPLNDLIAADDEIRSYLPGVDLSAHMDLENYLGDAPRRARNLAAEINLKVRKPGETPTD